MNLDLFVISSTLCKLILSLWLGLLALLIFSCGKNGQEGELHPREKFEIIKAPPEKGNCCGYGHAKGGIMEQLQDVKGKMRLYFTKESEDTCLLNAIFAEHINGEMHSLMQPFLDSLQSKAMSSKNIRNATRLYCISLVISPINGLERYRRQELQAKWPMLGEVDFWQDSLLQSQVLAFCFANKDRDQSEMTKYYDEKRSLGKKVESQFVCE